MSKPYLLFYNIASALAWAFVLYTVITSVSKGDDVSKFWSKYGTIITIIQSCAGLEILHSAFGLVRSPLLPTFMQVFSRLAIVWAYMMPTNASSGHWSAYLCIGAWALVEIPRYLFYFNALLTKGSHEINSVLFFLRYNLFIVLYPSGISGELFQMYNAYPLTNIADSIGIRLVIFHLLLYVPLAPFMIFNMWGNKKRAYKKRSRAANPRPLSGLIWPVTDKKTDARSTTKTNRAIWAASVEGVNKSTATKCEKERNWRFKYQKHVMKNVELSCTSKDNALAIANAGLEKAYDLFEFKRGDDIMSFKKAMTKGEIKDNYDTKIMKGDKEKIDTALRVPYGGGDYQGKPYYLGRNNKKVLTGLELKEQLKKWVDYGTIEPSAADGINEVDTFRDKWLDLSNHYFILLGATSAMGPLYFLLSYGANIICVDLDRSGIWEKLFAAVKDSPGRIIFPVKKGIDTSDMKEGELAKVAGSNLLDKTPEIANWLETVIEQEVKDKPLSIGNYTYLDGALHVQLSLACDGIINRVCNVRKDTMICFLCTPTDNHVVTSEAYKASKEALKTRVPSWASILDTIFCGKLLGKSNYESMKAVTQKGDGDNDPIYIIDGIAVAQGPNYALAKRMQHWRAVIQYEKGHKVSSNVAPSTATMSVVHNAQFAAAYGGMHYFPPMEVMYQRTSLAVMGTLMINDLMNKDSAANPKSKLGKSFRNPFELFSYGSFHGGVWRCSYKINNIGVPSALAFYINQYKYPVFIAGVNIILGSKWLLTGKFLPF